MLDPGHSNSDNIKLQTLYKNPSVFSTGHSSTDDAVLNRKMARQRSISSVVKAKQVGSKSIEGHHFKILAK